MSIVLVDLRQTRVKHEWSLTLEAVAIYRHTTSAVMSSKVASLKHELRAHESLQYGVERATHEDRPLG